MDKTKPGYRSYFVKSDPAQCEVTGFGRQIQNNHAPVLAREGGRLWCAEGPPPSSRCGDLTVRAWAWPGRRAFAPDRSGVYMVSIRTAAGITVRKAALY